MISLRPAPSDSLIANSRRLASARKSDIVVDVDARDQQHEGGGGRQHAERHEHVTELAVAERIEADRPPRIGRVVSGRVRLQVPRDTLQIQPGLRGAHTCLKPAHDGEVVVAAVRLAPGAQVQRQPHGHARFGIGEGGREDPDDGALDAVQADGASEHVFGSAEVHAPELGADDRHRTRGVLFFGRVKSASTRRSHAEHVEQVRGDVRHLHALGSVLRGERGATPLGRGKPLEGPLAGSIVQELRA